jgi:hypothetical protein
VDERVDFFVGEGSKVGKLPLGVWRVETMATMLRGKRRMRWDRLERSGRVRAGQWRREEG